MAPLPSNANAVITRWQQRLPETWVYASDETMHYILSITAAQRAVDHSMKQTPRRQRQERSLTLRRQKPFTLKRQKP